MRTKDRKHPKRKRAPEIPFELALESRKNPGGFQG
jgi:hypothetical protein